jgi:hypothetical protein
MCNHWTTSGKSVIKNLYTIRKDWKFRLIPSLPDFFCIIRKLLFLLIILYTGVAFAGNPDDPAGGRSAGLSHASVSLYDAWSCFNNQAGLAYITKPSAGVYFEKRYNIKEFSTKAGFIEYPLYPGTLALSYRHFGFSQYYESKIGLAFARKLFKRFSMGVQMDYFQTHIAENYGNFNALAVEIGLLSQPMDHLFIGFHVFNPVALTKHTGSELPLPATVRFGLSYLLEERILFAIESLNSNQTGAQYRMGAELQAANKLFIRIGLTTQVNHYSIGFGYSIRKVMIDISFTDHRILGYSPQASIILTL